MGVFGACEVWWKKLACFLWKKDLLYLFCLDVLISLCRIERLSTPVSLTYVLTAAISQIICSLQILASSQMMSSQHLILSTKLDGS